MRSAIVQLKVIEDDPDMLYFKYSYDSDYKNANSKQPVPGVLKWSEQQKDKCISLKSKSHQ